MTAPYPHSLAGSSGQWWTLLPGDNSSQTISPDGPRGRDFRMKAALIRTLAQSPHPSIHPATLGIWPPWGSGPHYS